jgi:hypothetical protein
MFKKQIQQMNKDIDKVKEDRKVLRSMEVFVLDNSLRESTVGQLRGHTIENKWKIYEEVSMTYTTYFVTVTRKVKHLKDPIFSIFVHFVP